MCKNLSSSRANDDIAEQHGCPMYSTAVGEINVAQKMQETRAVIGGEGILSIPRSAFCFNIMHWKKNFIPHSLNELSIL